MTVGKLIIVEGNIAAGKSTLCKGLQELDEKLIILFEPTDSNPFLKLFYQDPHKYALPMQLFLLRNRFRYYAHALSLVLEGNDVILDRSIFSDSVFADQTHIDGFIDEAGYAYYYELRDYLLSLVPVPHVSIFLDVEPDECLNRIVNIRKRECESGIPIAYLEGLSSCYKTFVMDIEQRGSNLLHLDWNSYGECEQVFNFINHEDRVDPPTWSLVDINKLHDCVNSEKWLRTVLDKDDELLSLEDSQQIEVDFLDEESRRMVSPMKCD
ncbi:hypothetical protein PCE1_003414 [Barthelona sp. PCE]